MSTAVISVAKSDDKWEVTDSSGAVATFDHVVFACHSDQALKMIHSPTSLHEDILGNIPYAENDVVMHKDISQLPKRSWHGQVGTTA